MLHFFCQCCCLMIRPPPRSTPTDTLFPYTTLFRSADGAGNLRHRLSRTTAHRRAARTGLPAHQTLSARDAAGRHLAGALLRRKHGSSLTRPRPGGDVGYLPTLSLRSVERRVGKECVSTGSSRGCPYP